MMVRTVLFFCASLVQCITAYVCDPYTQRPYEVFPYAYPISGYSPASLAASNCGGLFVSSSSPIAPSGVITLSDNAFEGSLGVGGQIPFLGAVAVQGALPSAGAGGVAYGCGNGNVAILAEDLKGSAPGTYAYY